MSKDKAALLNGVRTGMLSLFAFAVSVMHKLTDRTVAATHDIMNFPMLIFLLQRFEIHAEKSVFHFYQSASGLFSVMSVYGNPEIGIEAARLGNKVIMVNSQYSYFDYYLSVWWIRFYGIVDGIRNKRTQLSLINRNI